MGPYYAGMNRKRSVQHSQDEWREIAYRAYRREREDDAVVNYAFGEARESHPQWRCEDRVSDMLRFEARYQQDAQAEATRQQHKAAAQRAKLQKIYEIAQARALQQPLVFEEAV